MTARQRILHAALAGALVASLWAPLSCASRPGPPRPAAPGEVTPSLWRALRGDGSEAFYLLGSVHLGRPSTLHFPDAIRRAFARADELVLEIDFGEDTAEEEVETVRRHAFLKPPVTLRDRVSRDTLARLERYLDEREESLARYLEFEPWYVAITLTTQEALRAGLEARFGVDRYFAEQASGSKPVRGLESFASQLELLSELSDEIQEQMLVDAIEDARHSPGSAEQIVLAWEKGDDAAIEQIAFRSGGESRLLEELYERVNYRRNAEMARQLEKISADGRMRFVVVGAAHLIGERGVPALLRKLGFRMQRIRVR